MLYEVITEEALKLLVNDVASISEIAYKVGFTSPTYFSRCFHDRYDHTAIEIRNMAENEGKDTVLDRLGSLSEEKSVKNLRSIWSLVFLIPAVVVIVS